jgi:2-C-methyl-D-erythritol 4-phosphate cytidylyltransferase/2-C-methyl-D-erythritol 2,4-cyclodiphosphate synthase
MPPSSARKVAVIIVAAGRGVRAGGGLPKQYRPLAGKPVLAHTLAAFARHGEISRVQAVIHSDDRALYDEAAAGLDLPAPVAGGATRQASVLNGLKALADDAPDLVLIHDGARPLVPAATISAVIAALKTHEGAIAALPVADTLKRGDGSGRITGTVAREGLWRAQTPQGFSFRAIFAAHEAAGHDAHTDDAAVAEAAGLSVALVRDDPRNIKITTAEDFALAEKFLNTETRMETRVGFGFDVHRFRPGDHVWLCGIKVPHDKSLLGHSDADAGLHAVTDALLGAIGEGDIGQHFPPSDPQWKGASSDRFLAHAAGLLRARGGRIVHADVTLICEAPKIGPHRPAMTARMAEILELPASRVSVKATTTEKLGFTGRGEGIAAQAVVTVELPREAP